MLKGILLAAGLVLMALGAESLYRQLAHRSPVAVTCAEYVRARPSAEWLHVRGCQVDYLNAGYRETDGTIQELFFPIRPQGAPATEPAAMVAATRNPAVLAIAQSAIGQGRQPNQEQFLLMMLRIVTTLGASREIVGRVRTGLLERIRARRILSGLTAPLAPGAVVLDLNAQPRLAVPAIELAIGLALVAGMVILRRRPWGRRQPAPAAPVPAPEVPQVAGAGPLPEDVPATAATFPDTVAGALPEEVPATVLEPVRVRGLLLLNLRPEDGPEHIEYAAPLGTREETIRQISRVLDGIHFDARGRGQLNTARFAVIVDIGPGEPVSSAVAGADGPGGAEAVRRLMIETGWRAYVPITGRFMNPDELREVSAPVRSSR